MIAIICILVVIFPITTITGRITDNNNEIEKATLQRKNIEKILKYKDILNENNTKKNNITPNSSNITLSIHIDLIIIATHLSY